jgi:hypothetical protein
MKRLLFILSVVFSLQKGTSQNSLGPIDPFDKGNAYTSGTIVFSAIDLTFTTFNVVRLLKTDPHKSNAYFGLMMGTGQTVYGILNANATEKNAGAYTGINIGMGFVTVLTSAARLLKKSPPKESGVSFKLFCLPAIEGNHSAIGLHLSKRFK